MSPRLVVGVDPGVDGGVAVLDARTRALLYGLPLPQLNREPDVAWLAGFLATLEAERGSVALVAVEEQTARPLQGAGVTLKIGRTHGMLLGAILAAGYPLERPIPARWQRVVVSRRPGDDKEATIAWVLANFPGVDLYPGKRRKAHDGVADAVGIASWAAGRLEGRE